MQNEKKGKGENVWVFDNLQTVKKEMKYIYIHPCDIIEKNYRIPPHLYRERARHSN